MTFPPRTTWLVVALTCMTIGLVFGISGYPLLDPDEGRNAEVAREMAETNDYAIPRLNSLPYVDKPVVFFAVAAAFIEILGPTELAVRLAPLLFTCLTLTAVWWFAARLYGRTSAWTATIATGTMPLTLAFARTVIFDSALTFFVVTSLIGLYFTIEDDGPRAPWWSSLGFLSIGMGLLTKGPIALALPLMIVIPFAIWRRRAKKLLDPVGLLLLVAAVLPWVAVMSRSVPDFLRYVVLTETTGRLFTDELRRTGPFWYFLPIIVAGSLPWSLLVLPAWKSARRELNQPLLQDPRLVFWLLWILVPLVFFSLSQSKRPQYMVPLMPAIGLLVCHLWCVGSERARGLRATSVGLTALAVILGLAPLIVGQLLDVDPDIAAAIGPTSLVLAGATFTSATGIWLLPRRIPIALALLSVPAAAIPLGSTELMKAIGRDRSTRAAADAIADVMQPNTEIVTIDAFPLSMPFYLNRTLTMSTTDGSELTSNYLTRYLDSFRTRLDSPLKSGDWWLTAITTCNRPRIFIVRSGNVTVRRVLDGRLRLIVDNGRYAAYGPCDVQALALRTASRDERDD